MAKDCSLIIVLSPREGLEAMDVRHNVFKETLEKVSALGNAIKNGEDPLWTRELVGNEVHYRSGDVWSDIM